MGGGGGSDGDGEDGGEGKRHQIMQNLFGDDQSEEEEEEIDSQHESSRHHPPSDEEEIERNGESEADVGESEGDAANQREGSKRRDCDSDDDKDEERVIAKDDVVVRSQFESEEEEKEKEDVKIRNVFGSSDDEDNGDEYIRKDRSSSPIEDEEDSEKDRRRTGFKMMARDMIDCGGCGRSLESEDDDEHIEAKSKEKPVGPPLDLELPFCPPLGDPAKMNMIKVSSIMRIDPKPFDAKTFVEEDPFETDESGGNKRIRLLNNIVRHRVVKRRDGKTYNESNARFVRWSDGSLQLLIGNEVLDVIEQDAQQEQNHVCTRHEKGMLQSQGRVTKKMKFIPSSLTSNSHMQLSALVESRQKKGYKVKNCVTDIDPEREKEKREKAERQTLKASAKLSHAREKISRKYSLPVDRRQQLSTGYLEDALEEDEETDRYGSHRSYEEELKAEKEQERRIINAKKSRKGFPGKSSLTSERSSRRQVEYSESEREEEESEYETEEEEEEEEEEEMPTPPRKRVKETKYEDEVEEEKEEEAEKKKRHGSGRKRKEIESDDEESPPRKAPTHRRKALMVYDSDEDS